MHHVHVGQKVGDRRSNLLAAFHAGTKSPLDDKRTGPCSALLDPLVREVFEGYTLEQVLRDTGQTGDGQSLLLCAAPGTGVLVCFVRGVASGKHAGHPGRTGDAIRHVERAVCRAHSDLVCAVRPVCEGGVVLVLFEDTLRGLGPDRARVVRQLVRGAVRVDVVLGTGAAGHEIACSVQTADDQFFKRRGDTACRADWDGLQVSQDSGADAVVHELLCVFSVLLRMLYVDERADAVKVLVRSFDALRVV